MVVWFILWLPHLSRLQTIKVMHKVKFSGLHTTSDVASLAWFTCPGKDDKRTVHSSPQRLLNFWHIQGTEPIGRNLGFLQGTLLQPAARISYINKYTGPFLELCCCHTEVCGIVSGQPGIRYPASFFKPNAMSSLSGKHLPHKGYILTGDAAQLVECLSTMHKSLGLIPVTTYNWVWYIFVIWKGESRIP